MHRNPGGGTFGPEQTIGTGANNVRQTAVADFDGDGDMDVAAALFGANTAGVNPHPNTADFDRDPDAYDAVGKVGLGGLALSEEENVMWTINLADRN